MSKVLQVRVDDKLKAAADEVFSSIGLDTSSAVRMFLTATVERRGLPFEPKGHVAAIELFDGHGSYICGYGHLHDFSKVNPGDLGGVSGPYESMEALKAALDD